MNMSIDEIKDICVQIAINGVHISQKIKSNHCMMMVLASAQIDNSYLRRKMVIMIMTMIKILSWVVSM